MTTPLPVTFRVPDACAYLGISHYLLRKLVREQKIAHIRAGKLLLFRQDALDACPLHRSHVICGYWPLVCKPPCIDS